MEVDHSDDSQVIALFDRIRREQKGRLDILVNNVYGGTDAPTNYTSEDPKFWNVGANESPAAPWDRIMRVGLRNHYICSVLASRLMLEYRGELYEDSVIDSKSPGSERPGLIFNISSFGGLQYMFSVPYGVGMS